MSEVQNNPTPPVSKLIREQSSVVQKQQEKRSKLKLPIDYLNQKQNPKPRKSKKVKPVTDLNDFESRFTDANEQRLAKLLLDKYLVDYTIETASEINTLKEIVFLEIIQLRLQNKLNSVYSDGTEDIPTNVLDTIHKNSKAILDLKDTLGFKKSSKDKELKGFDAFEQLKKRHSKWRQENQATRHIKCPHCMKFVHLLMRTDAWEARKHPFFQDNFICNKHLLDNLGKTLLIDATFVAKVLEVSPDYISWVLEKIKPKTEITRKESDGDQISKESVSEKADSKEEVIIEVSTSEPIVTETENNGNQ